MKRLLHKYYEWRLNLRKIQSYINGLETKSKLLKHDNANTKVSCVQRTIKLVKNVEEYIDMINNFVVKAVEEESSLIVFPEYNFFDLLGLIPGLKRINQMVNNKTVSEKDSKSEGGERLIYAIFFATAEPIQKAIEQIMCSLAKKYGIYIYTGSYLIKKDNKLYNGGVLVSKEGKIIGIQKKIHLTDFEEKLGIKRDSVLNVYSLDIGNVAFPVCMDATYFETSYISRNLGCDILIIPIANNEEYSLYRAIRGIWARVQESHIYGLKSSLNGWFFGIYFTGKAGIFAPINLTKKMDGIITIADHPEGNYLLTATLDLNKLYKERERSEYYGDVNPNFEREYYKKTYKTLIDK